MIFEAVSKLSKASAVLGISLLLWQGLAASGAAEDLLVPVAVPAKTPDSAQDLPLAGEEEIPEEILRTEIITGARSPLTGEPMTAAEYAQLQATLDGPQGTPLLSNDIRYLIFLLQIRRAVRPILPFIK